MYSMTGYGRGEATNGDVTVVVELKTVNNRFRDINLRLPREYLVLEPRIHAAIKGPVRRGRVEAFVRRSAADSNQTVRPDPVLAEHYHSAIAAVAKRLQRDPAEVPLEFILAQPGVLTLADAEHDALSEWDLLHTALQAALADLTAMRGTEGEALRRDLVRHTDELQRLRAEVADAAEGINERLVKRLNARFAKLLGDRVEPARLAQESAILADKADVSEELLRIQSHLDQFQDALGASKPVGRKLEFLVQELNREVNTIGSKAAEHPVSARVVEMKSVIERLREQAANVE
jgi:uncharacterized protein (TIGR00255 family)